MPLETAFYKPEEKMEIYDPFANDGYNQKEIDKVLNGTPVELRPE
jgi:hypothetical protein